MKIIKKFYKHFIIFASALLIANYTVEAFFQYQKDKYLNAQTELFKGSYKTQYTYLKIMSNDIYVMYQENKKLISLFSQAKDVNSSKQAQIRNKMYRMLLKRYKRLENMGVGQLHFHLPNNTSFLRMNRLTKFGDDLSGFRESVVYVNATHKEIENFEAGRFNNGFRFVFPLFDTADKTKKRRYIGSMEVSYSGENLLNNIGDKFVLDKHFLALQSEVIKNGQQEYIDTFYEDSLENSDYLMKKENYSKKYDATIKKILLNGKLKEKIYLKMKEEKPFSIAGHDNFHSTVITFLPIKNIKNRTVAYLVLYLDADYINSIDSDRYYTKLLLFSIIFMLFLFSIYATITQQKLREMAHFDKLTQLPNRAYFYIELTQEIKRAKRFQKQLSVMFIDLDRFKQVNDAYGHNVGDKLLIEVAQRLENSIRSIDIVGRIGGDEFIVLLTDIQEGRDFLIVAEKILNSMNKDFVINHHIINVGASIGIANYPEHGEDLESLIKNADNAMYEAKRNGKNRVIVHGDKNFTS